MKPSQDLPETRAANDHWDHVYSAKEPCPQSPEHPVFRAAVEHFGSLEGVRVCDLGCGTGEFALAFAAAGAEVVAIDRSEAATQRLSEWVVKQGIKNLTVVCDDALQVAKYGPFDRMFGAMILHHVEPFDALVSALDNALAMDGRAFFFENNAGIGRLALWFRAHLAGKGWFPKHGDPDEFPLTGREVAQLRERFAVRVVFPELALFRLVSHYIFRDRVFPGFFAWLDRFAYRFRQIRTMSYQQYLLLASAGDREFS
ncbi:MAG: class I SAM-dependent methyltransferase [Candidatus Sericytochromatia bacterium]|nr:class I SAM-dependent methyltransferase [Candidatus Sericytochromatia bacterium]